MDARQHERSVSLRALLYTLGQQAAWDAIAPYRPAIVTFGGGMFSAALAPLALWHLLGGRWAIAAVTAVASVLVGLAGWLTHRHGTHQGLLTAGLLALVGLTASGTWLIGVDALLWAYPAALVIYFIVPPRAAHAVALVHVVACTTVTAFKLGGDVGVRVAVTMSLSIVYINVVMGVIGRLQQSLEQQAMTDALTGMLNRRRFDGELASHSAVAGSDALLALDIDHFKSINDTYGHAAGDDVLKAMASLMQSQIRSTDRLYRVGGEEFAILLRQVTAAQAMRVAEGIRRAVEEGRFLDGRVVTVSVGVTMNPAPWEAERWLELSDRALYEAKRTGRNRIVFGEPTP